MCISDLPKPNNPELHSGVYHGEGRCAFAPDGQTFAFGAEDGSLMLFDINGALVI